MSFSGPFGDSENIPPRGEMVRARGRAWRCDAGSDRPREAHATRVRPHASIAISKPRIRGSIDPRRATPTKFKTRLFAAEATSAEAAGRGVGKSGRSPEESSPVTAKGSKAPSIGITCPAFTPCDANVDRGAHPGSRMRGARLGAAREKGTCILSPRRISERGGWGLVETETHRRARAISGARVAARVATVDIVRMRCG
jgi:hypothetical protein